MQLFRRLTALLLILALPPYAWAALGVPENCPMKADTAVEASSGDIPPCCPDTADDTSPPAEGRPCQAGQQCKTANLYFVPFPGPLPAGVIPDTVVATASSLSLSADPARIWRPPRAR